MMAIHSSGKQGLYAVLALLGLSLTWYFNFQHIAEQGSLSLLSFVSAAYVNHASTSIANDVLIAALTFLCWSFMEARQVGMRHWWLYVVLTFGLAFAFAFPLFLLMRERKLHALSHPQSRS